MHHPLDALFWAWRTYALVAGSVANAACIDKVIHAFRRHFAVPYRGSAKRPSHRTRAPCYISSMKLNGTYKFDATQERLWDALLDPDVVSECIPGVQKFDTVSPDSYEIEIGVKVGVFSGSINGTLEISDREPLSSYRMRITGASPMTNLTGEALVSLIAEDDATTLSFDGDVRVTGALARVGQRFMSSAAKSQFDRFFERLGEKVG